MVRSADNIISHTKILALIAAALIVWSADFSSAFFMETDTDNRAFTETLQKNVHNGHVNYKALCKDPALSTYVAQLSKTAPDGSEESQLAFWINAYNAYTLKVICDHYPVKSINELHRGGLIIGTLTKGTIWDKKLAIINGEPLTLNHIEHEVIRKQFHEPRAHFALVCASVSCPALRPEAYEAAKLNEQLEDQAKLFFADSGKNSFDVPDKIAHLSKILDWYSGDFGKTKQDVLLFVSRFVAEPIASEIRKDPGKWKIEYTDYNWDLNE